MCKLKVLLADDEPYSRDELKHLLSKYDRSLQIIGEAEHGEEAVMKCMQMQPDVIFLDIEMHHLNGLEVAKLLNELKKPPKIIFSTAFPQFAIEAFRYEAFDYLVKPFDEDQLSETILRLKRQFVQPSLTHGPAKGKLAIEVNSEILYVDPDDILYVCKEENLTKIVTKKVDYEVKTSLKELENRLISFTFFRIHKSYLVNLSYITRLTPWFNGAYQLELDGRKEKLSVSRNYIKALRNELEI